MCRDLTSTAHPLNSNCYNGVTCMASGSAISIAARHSCLPTGHQTGPAIIRIRNLKKEHDQTLQEEYEHQQDELEFTPNR